MIVIFILGLFLVQLGQTEVVTQTEAAGNEEDSYYPPETWSNTFDWRIVKEYSPLYRNLLVSPISLKTILSLLYQGASGITKRELENVLQFTDQESAKQECRNILNKLQPSETPEYNLNFGSRIFLDTPIQPQQKFASTAKEFFKTDIGFTNFSNAQEAADSINAWAEKLTNGRIPKVIDQADLAEAIMVIVNAIYFKGSWRYQFSNQTVDKFYVPDGNNFFSIQARFMSVEDKFYYHESSALDAKIIRLPYKGGNYSMFILLPNSKGGLPYLVKQINLNNLKSLLYLMEPRAVNVKLPKFKFDFQARFSKTLHDFGLLQMFQNTASFPGIARGNSTILRKLVVTDIVQKSGIEVNEYGSIVYAATELTIGNKFGELLSTFHATHPFLFYIEEETSGTILFIGKVENPLEVDPQPLAQKPE
ncbi:serine protease inhibitor 27A-like [Diorhabda carinulata]|uniref:serine protease inhibitor 27A-like n=1 Tax=Diorhabda carinulata TaxID=1163345 RepID=UPI0025A139A2|nr:serine protease inhibitor 27A-like [Diorhabda carinulata]